MRSFRRGSILLLLMLGAPALAQAVWQPDGNPIGAGAGFVATASGPDRVIVAWSRQFGSSLDLRAQAWTADGDLVAGCGGWSPRRRGGSSVAARWLWSRMAREAVSSPGRPRRRQSERVRVQHLSASGIVAAGWPAEGVALGASYLVALAPDGAGGVLVARLEYDADPFDFRVIVHRFDAAALPVPGWPADGLTFPHTHEVGLLVDADHHLFVSTVESDPATGRELGMIVRRLQENGTPDPAWPANGALIADGRYGSRPRLFPDGAGGAFPSGHSTTFASNTAPTSPTSRLPGFSVTDRHTAAGSRPAVDIPSRPMAWAGSSSALSTWGDRRWFAWMRTVPQCRAGRRRGTPP